MALWMFQRAESLMVCFGIVVVCVCRLSVLGREEGASVSLMSFRSIMHLSHSPSLSLRVRFKTNTNFHPITI